MCIRDSVETTWLRLELIKASLSGEDDKKETHPIVPRLYGIEIGVNKTIGQDTYEEPLPGAQVAQLDHRERNRRLTRVVTASNGRLAEFFPYYSFIDIEQKTGLTVNVHQPTQANLHLKRFSCDYSKLQRG